MNSYLRQFPDIYKSNNDSYVYFSDDGTRFHLIAGQDGVTEEWIEYLKNEHRKSYNKFRRAQCPRRAGEKKVASVISLEAYGISFAEEILGLVDPMPSAENRLIENEECKAFQARFLKAWRALSNAQRQLMIDVYIRRIPQTEIARREHIDPTSLRDRLKAAKNRFKKFF